jgi:hypothetical protein
MMVALRSSETSVLIRATWRNIQEDCILHSHRRENLNSYNANIYTCHNTILLFAPKGFLSSCTLVLNHSAQIKRSTWYGWLHKNGRMSPLQWWSLREHFRYNTWSMGKIDYRANTFLHGPSTIYKEKGKSARNMGTTRQEVGLDKRRRGRGRYVNNYYRNDANFR